ncbi:ribosome silencing factor [Curvibacter sp. APW13]|uniref:ribosome silencing factor n=1 Tax=Curvibacter sp. APW13 TaxID=3077236 RepID=UPI0028DE7499|nr:ribosome silencing factor [Curvibacter sp. APW13]MDT8991550.1 ribosome silencing factor [Curvibacter sp. APW13]
MTTTTTEKRDVQKLQRAIVDGLEDVKAQEIKVFDTAHLSPLFERVVIASGTSNRQTKALSASVIDAVREAGFPKPRVEGEANGEWIIVDCGQAVVHIMQPNFRTYYQLEELWGEKPVRLKLGAEKPAAPSKLAPKAAAKKAADKEQPVNLRRSSAAKKGVAEAFPSKAQLKKQEAAAKPAAKKAATKTASPAAKRVAAKTAAPKPVKTVVVGAPAKKTAAKKVAAKPAARKPAAKKAPARKA